MGNITSLMRTRAVLTPSIMKPSQPLIVVCGPTGTGKSKLAVSLAKRFNGEIINADAVQMYKGLPIVTNKIPVHEMEGIPHHLLGEIELTAAPWNVTNFTAASISIIERIRARGRIPIVVGGTGHYIGACTDSTLQDPLRRSDCEGLATENIVYRPELDAWTCVDDLACVSRRSFRPIIPRRRVTFADQAAL